MRHPTVNLAAPVALATLLVPLAACLEIEEEVEVRPDGSVSVLVTARGDEPDLADGFPLPTWGAWSAADETTLAWLAGETLPEDSDGVRMQAEFASVDDLPASWAPPTEPYRSAYLERSSELEVLRKGARTVYVFTRVLKARRNSDWNPSARIDTGLDDDVREALEAEVELTPNQWERAVVTVREAYRQACRAQARFALVGIYTQGEGEVSVDAHERVLARLDQAVGAVITESRMRSLYALIRNANAEPGEERQQIPPELDLDLAAREAVRAALPAALTDEGVSDGVRNAVLASLEWSFSAIDQTADLSDEGFVLRLRLPGRIVDGNFTSLDEGAAIWSAKGTELYDRDVVWRAVSVLE